MSEQTGRHPSTPRIRPTGRRSRAIGRSSALVRRTVGLATALVALGVGSVLLAATASAEPPVDWPSTPAVQPWHVLLVLVGIPVLLFIVLVAFLYVPPAVRGEPLLPRYTPTQPEGEWIGGPRRAAGELAGPDGEQSKAGGAGGSW